MKYFIHTLAGLLLLLMVLPSCNKSGVYEQRAKSVDSLSGALSALVAELDKTDTISLNKALSRFTYYSRFVELNVKDTISKEAADELLHFYNSGKKLEAYAFNRSVLRERSLTLNLQLQKLSKDVRARAVNLNILDKNFLHEQQEAARILTAGRQQQAAFFEGMQEYKLSLRHVEQLIRSHNNGELPVIVKDTIDL